MFANKTLKVQSARETLFPRLKYICVCVCVCVCVLVLVDYKDISPVYIPAL